MVSENISAKILEGLLFPKIFRTFRMAIQPTKLIIIFSALIIICLAGWIMDRSETVVVIRNTKGEIIETELQTYMNNPSQMKAYMETYRGKSRGAGVFFTLWHFAAAKFQGSVDSVFALDIPGVVKNVADYFKAAEWALRHHFIYCIIFFVINLAVISVAGGAICRIAALQFARGEKPGLTEAMRFSTKRFTSFFVAPLTPIGIIIAPLLFIFILGLTGNIPWAGELIIGISIPLALIAGALITVVLIGMFAGLNLMFPAVAYDGSDCFDSISRSFSYVYAKPWRMGFYTTIAAVYGAISYTFVRFLPLYCFGYTPFPELGVWTENSKRSISLRPSGQTGIYKVGSSNLAATNWTESLGLFGVLVFIGRRRHSSFFRNKLLFLCQYYNLLAYALQS